MQKIFTTGYAEKSVEKLPLLLDKKEAVLADIRFVPHSKDLEWRKIYLSMLLGKRYHHVSALGNRMSQTDKIQIHNMELGIRLIESWKVNVVLMCGCADFEKCHRRVIKNEFEKRGLFTEEITDW